ncbi:MAG: hypothetical protein ACREC9_12430 [Methylocella sp.]
MLDGRKTQTRRANVERWKHAKAGDRVWVREALCAYNLDLAGEFGLCEPLTALDMTHCDVRASYSADCTRCITGDEFPLAWIWKRPALPAIYMPRSFSRFTLIVEGAKIERLQSISEEDARAEGIERLRSGRGYYDPRFGHGGIHLGYFDTARDAFETLWDSIHSNGAWHANPWVAAISFSVIKANIDAVAELERM